MHPYFLEVALAQRQQELMGRRTGLLVRQTRPQPGRSGILLGMRKKLILSLLSVLAVAGFMAAPGAHAASKLPTVKRDSCGNINVYDQNGNPLFEYNSLVCWQ